MNTIIKSMISKYEIIDNTDEINAMKEVIQEIVLSGLSRGGFFNEAAFYGGTALRIFYDLDRFSEDLDFALLEPNINFSLDKYFETIEEEIASHGFIMKVNRKNKTNDSNIDSAFISGDTKTMILNFFPNEILKNDGKYKDIKIKFEIDINPPMGAKYETRTKALPQVHQIKLYDKPSLFAGKIHAVLCRNWKKRIKGRDLYDYMFYIKWNTDINMELLRNKLIASEVLKESDRFDIEVLKKMLIKKFEEIDFNNAKEDVYRFLHKDNEGLDYFTKDVFVELTKTYFNDLGKVKTI